MKKLITCLFLLVLNFNVKSQCGLNTPSGDTVRLSGSGQSTNLLYAEGQYAIFYVQAGVNYNITTCVGSQGSGNINDTQLSVYAENGSLLAYNDDYCSLQSNVNFTPANCGYAKVQLHQYSCNNSGTQIFVYFNQNSDPTFNPVTTTSSQTNVTCNGGNNGSITLNPSGGTRPYHYTWSNAATDSSITGLSAGIYTVGIKDSLSCIPTPPSNTYTITQPALITKTQNTSFCAGMSLSVGIHTYTATGVYVDTLHTALGCDSIITSNITVYQPDTTKLNNIICANAGYSFYGTTLTTAGVYNHLLSNIHGCDSTIILTLVDHRSNSTSSQTTCDSYIFNGTTLTTSGTYTYSSTNAVGCDSLVTLNLTINNSSSSNNTVTACGNYNFNGTTLTTSGTYTYSTTNMAGCDSLVTLNLTINNSSSSTSSVTTCTSYTFNGTSITTSGTYTYSTTNMAGCDSLVTLNLTINNSSSSNNTVTACGNYNFNGTTLTTSGTYTYSTTNMAGCDSLITLNLTINNVDVSVSQISNTITANATPATYQWVDCNTSNSILAGETNQSFTTTNNGLYAVIVTQNTCVDTSLCYSINTTGISTLKSNFNIQVYPNPTTGNFTIKADKGLQNSQVIIYNQLGQIILNQPISNQLTDFNLDINAGVYQVRVLTGNEVIYQSKIIKQ